VSRSSGDGRSLELYRVVPGELCLVSSACLFRTQPLSAHGVATKATTLILISPAIFNQWLVTPAFRSDVLGLFAERMADLTSLIDAVAFQKLDQRLAALLLEEAPELKTSHAKLADRLGTVRDIVGRLLKNFEQRELVALSRERIRVLNAVGLKEVADRQG